jgi:uncharacterized protein (TIGR02145 family)
VLAKPKKNYAIVAQYLAKSYVPRGLARVKTNGKEIKMKTTITMLLLFCAICFAQRPLDSTSDYTKCLEKYNALSEQVKGGQSKCLQEYQTQSTKNTGDYTKCLEASGYTKCQPTYQTQITKAVSDNTKCQQTSGHTKCAQEYQAKLTQNQTTSGSAECIEEYKAQLAQGIKTAANDYTKCMGVVQSVIAEANKITMSDYNKCLEASGYTKCQQDYQAQVAKLSSNLAKCQEASGYTKCVQKYQAQVTKLPSDYSKCLEKYNALSEQVTSGKSKCLQEYQAQQAKINTEAYTDTFIDLRDSKKYKIVKIGEQVWMAENLNYNASGSECYGNETSNCDKYGRLYNWETAMKACPKGWHLPSDAEWDILIVSVGGRETAGKFLKATNGWYENGNGTDKFSFSALPGGFGSSGGGFFNVGYLGDWWSATENNSRYANIMGMSYNYEGVGYYNYDKDFLLSVRCLQD